MPIIGSPDYWQSREQLFQMLTKLDSIDGNTDGVLTLADLNSEQNEMLAKLAGIDTSLLTGSDLIDKLDGLDGTMDGKLTLAELNTSDVKTNLDSTLTKLDTQIGKLTDNIAELTGVHGDTSDMVAYGEEDWSGGAGDALVCDALIAGDNVKRNMLRVTNTSGYDISYARHAGADRLGYIGAGSSAVFYDSPGVWSGGTGLSFSAHEEWAT